jgi:hypothetical protein
MMESGANGNNLAAAAMRRHPVEILQQRQGKTEWHEKEL